MTSIGQTIIVIDMHVLFMMPKGKQTARVKCNLHPYSQFPHYGKISRHM